MREMGWSWRQYQETSFYVRRVTWDCIQARRSAENARNGEPDPYRGQETVRRRVQR